MCRADIGDQSDVRFCDFSQPADFSPCVCTHLQDGQFMLGVDIENGHGKTDKVIVISLCLDNFFRESGNACQHFLRRCFSGTACDRDNPDPKFLSPEMGYIPQGLQGIVNTDDGFVCKLLSYLIFISPLYQEAVSPIFYCGGDKIMTVEFFSYEGDKQTS